MWILFRVCLYGQHGEHLSYALPEVMVTDSARHPFADPDRSIPLNLHALRPLTTQQLLERVGTVIRSYGPGQLSTISWHGMPGAATGLYWHDLPIRDALTGQLDASGVSLYLLGDRMEFSSSNTREGLPGAQIRVKPHLPLGDARQSAGAGVLLGQYGLRQYSGQLGVARPRCALNGRAISLTNPNHFPYESAGTRRYLSHALRQYRGASLEARGRMSGRQWWDAAAFWALDDKEVPPRLLQTQSAARTGSDRKMLSLGWKQLGDSSRWEARLSAMRLGTDYSDSLSNIDFHGQTEQARANVAYFTQYQQWRWQAGTGVRLIRGQSTGFSGVKRVGEHDITLSLQRRMRKGAGLLHGRFLYDSDGRKMLTFSGRYVLPVTSGKWMIEVGKYGRLPSLNDLYWVPGGNPDLKAERSWGGDTRLSLSPWRTLKIHAALFVRSIRGYIQWLPQSGIFVARNVPSVLSRGGDLDLRYEMVDGWRFQSHYGFAKTTYTEPRLPNDAAKGKQLIYVPVHQGNNRLSRVGHTWTISLNHRWVGKRYITSDNSQSIAGYHLLDLSASYILHRQRWNAEWVVSVDNIADVSYEEVAGWIQPGRVASGGIILHFTY